jgi:hypothetical protein
LSAWVRRLGLQSVSSGSPLIRTYPASDPTRGPAAECATTDPATAGVAGAGALTGKATLAGAGLQPADDHDP